jgi:hypothetical protein
MAEWGREGDIGFRDGGIDGGDGWGGSGRGMWGGEHVNWSNGPAGGSEFCK